MQSKEDNKDKFSVFTYELVPNTKENGGWSHWSKNLHMCIKKDGVSIKLTGDEVEQLVNSLPRTFGGTY